MTDTDDIQAKLKVIAETVNSFKSEAVQLRIAEFLLHELGISQTPSSERNREPRPSQKKPKRPRSRRSTAATDSAAKAPTKTARASTRSSPGAYAMIGELLDGGFFKAPKTIGSIVDHCRTAQGHHYKANECSPALLRLLRDKKLQRQKNKDGQYEYTQS